MSNSPALLTTAPLLARQLLAPVSVVLPLIFKVRPANSEELLAVIARLPFVVVWPLPPMMPPVQFVTPLIVRLSEPDNVPALRLSVVTWMVSLLLKLRFPKEFDTFSAEPTERRLTAALKLAKPAVASVLPVTL